MTVILFLVIAAFICAIVSALGKCPLWSAVILLCVVELIQVLPIK
jgi:hypothetical protein